MKILYSFPISRKVKSGGSKKTVKNKVCIRKPTPSQVEDGEFFYGQKFNEFINAGFLTKAMLGKRMGNIMSDNDEDRMETVMLENLEASKVVEFYGGAKDLDEEQSKKLEDAKKKFASTQKEIQEWQMAMSSQYSQTADAKAEQKLIEWFVFNFSYYEDKIDDKIEYFPIFQGETFEDKRAFYLKITDGDEDIKNEDLLKAKEIFDKSYDTLIKAITIWFNKMGEDQKGIDKAMKDLFNENEK
jgi:hypothetical protein